jgi:hypothetical protein
MAKTHRRNVLRKKGTVRNKKLRGGLGYYIRNKFRVDSRGKTTEEPKEISQASDNVYAYATMSSLPNVHSFPIPDREKGQYINYGYFMAQIQQQRQVDFFTIEMAIENHLKTEILPKIKNTYQLNIDLNHIKIYDFKCEQLVVPDYNNTREPAQMISAFLIQGNLYVYDLDKFVNKDVDNALVKSSNEDMSREIKSFLLPGNKKV